MVLCIPDSKIKSILTWQSRHPAIRILCTWEDPWDLSIRSRCPSCKSINVVHMDVMVQAMEGWAREYLGYVASTLCMVFYGDYWWLFSSAVNINLWEMKEYVGEDTQLLMLVRLTWISAQLILKTVSISSERTKVWVTIELAKVWHPSWCHLDLSNSIVVTRDSL